MPKKNREEALKPGYVLEGTYKIVEEIGSGGGGFVYKAVDLNVDRYVAIKQIKDDVKNILDSRAEVNILKDLKCDYLPQVYNFLTSKREVNGKTREEIYTVMEFVRGESLSSEIRKRSFTPKEVLKFTRQMAVALDLLHRQEHPIIHSDIKPANIMLTPEGNICLIDFNVSLICAKDARPAVGISIHYSPPEQFGDYEDYIKRKEQALEKERLREEKRAAREAEAAGNGKQAHGDESGDGKHAHGNESRWKAESHTETTKKMGPTTYTSDSEIETVFANVAGKGIDASSDIYALGATIYHLLTGVQPSADYTEIDPIREMNLEKDLGISEGFLLILEKMMAFDPKDRYANGTELKDALEHIHELDSEYKAFRRKEKIRGALMGLAFLAGLAAAGAGLVAMYRENQAVYNEQIEEAENLIEAGEYEKASAAISEAISRDETQIEAYEKEVLRLYTMGSYEELVSYARKISANGAYVIENETDEMLLADIFYLMGNAYIELEDYTNAVYYFTLALGYNTENSDYYRDYAIALAKNGDLDAAEEALDWAVHLGLEQDSISMTRGEISYERGDYEAAVDDLSAVARQAEDSDVLRRAVILCAKAYRKLGGDYLDDAISLLESSQSLFTATVSTQVTQLLGEAYMDKAQSSDDPRPYYEKALAVFEGLYKDGYTTRQIMENIAIIYEEMNLYDEAAWILERMTESYPDDYRTYKRLALLEADIQQDLDTEMRDYQDFADYYEKAVELYEASGGSGDEEMALLEILMQDLTDGGWF